MYTKKAAPSATPAVTQSVSVKDMETHILLKPVYYPDDFCPKLIFSLEAAIWIFVLFVLYYLAYHYILKNRIFKWGFAIILLVGTLIWYFEFTQAQGILPRIFPPSCI